MFDKSFLHYCCEYFVHRICKDWPIVVFSLLLPLFCVLFNSNLHIQNDDSSKNCDNLKTTHVQMASTQEIKVAVTNSSNNKKSLENFIVPVASCKDIFTNKSEDNTLEDKQQKILTMLKVLIRESSEFDHKNEYKFLLEQIDS